LEQSVDDELPLGANEGDVLQTRHFPDATFAMDADMKSHTENIQTSGTGAASTIFSKQKLNAKTSTEAELVAADDSVLLALWTRIFLKEKGHEIETTMCQDNASAMLLEKNGKESCSKRTRQMNIRCFFIKDFIDKGHLTMECCPIDDRTGDHPSKPLQG